MQKIQAPSLATVWPQLLCACCGLLARHSNYNDHRSSLHPTEPITAHRRCHPLPPTRRSRHRLQVAPLLLPLDADGSAYAGYLSTAVSPCPASSA